MTSVLLALWLVLIASRTATGQPAGGLREVRFTGPTAVEALCACLLDLRRSAEAQGRIDFAAEVESANPDELVDLTARVWAGSTHAVGRINFTGHTGLNDSTIRRAMTIYERDRLDVGQLRRSLARINDIGVFETLTLADISIGHGDDALVVPVTSEGPLEAEALVCVPPKARLWWLRRGAAVAGRVAFAALIP